MVPDHSLSVECAKSVPEVFLRILILSRYKECATKLPEQHLVYLRVASVCVKGCFVQYEGDNWSHFTHGKKLGNKLYENFV